MKTKCLVLLALLPACASTSVPSASGPGSDRPLFAAADRVRAKVDRSSGIRVYSVVPDVQESRAGKLSLASTLMDEGQGAAALPAMGQLGFQTTSKNVRFRECGRLELVVDGRQLLGRSPKYFGSLERGRVVEAVVVPVTPDELSRLVQADEVRYRLCGTRGALSSADRRLLGRMLAMWQAG